MFLLSTLGQHTTSFSDAVPRPPIEPTLLEGPATRAFLSRTLGDHMVLQAAPQRATIWGATTQLDVGKVGVLAATPAAATISAETFEPKQRSR